MAFTVLSRIVQDRTLSAVKDAVKFLWVLRGNINFISYSVFKGYSSATFNAQMNAKWVIEFPQLMLLKLSLPMPERPIPSSPLLLVPIDTWKWRDKGTLLIFKCQEENSQLSPPHKQHKCWKRILNAASCYITLRLKRSSPRKRGGKNSTRYACWN